MDSIHRIAAQQSTLKHPDHNQQQICSSKQPRNGMMVIHRKKLIESQNMTSSNLLSRNNISIDHSIPQPGRCCEYLREDALVYSAAFAEIQRQIEMEKNNSLKNSLSAAKLSQLIDQANQKKLTLESPEVLFLMKILMKKPSFRRSEKERQYIWNHMKMNPFFDNLSGFYPNRIMLELCRNMQIEEYSATQRIFAQGEIGKKFYVVLEGKTAAFSRIKKIEKENLFKLAIMRMLFEIIRSELSINPLQMYDLDPIRKIQYMYPDQILIGGHSKGQFFGEIALRNDCPRSASIFARTNVLLAVIQASDYRKIIQEFEDQKLQCSIEFLQQVSIFQGFKHNLLQEIWYLCKELHKDRNSVVYSEGMPATHIYLIQKGEVTISKTCESDSNHRGSQKLSEVAERLGDMNTVWLRDDREKRKETIILSTLGEYQCFGDFEMELSKQTVRSTHAVCTTDSIIIEISRKQLIHLLTERGKSERINQVFRTRKELYPTKCINSVETREKHRTFKPEERCRLVEDDSESVKVHFNAMRLLAKKCQFLQQHLMNISESNQEHATIWPKESFMTDEQQDLNKVTLGKQVTSKLLHFFSKNRVCEDQGNSTWFLMNFLKKTKNHHMVRLKLMWQQLQNGKPQLRHSIGQQFLDENKNNSSLNGQLKQEQLLRESLPLSKQHQLFDDTESSSEIDQDTEGNGINILHLSEYINKLSRQKNKLGEAVNSFITSQGNNISQSNDNSNENSPQLQYKQQTLLNTSCSSQQSKSLSTEYYTHGDSSNSRKYYTKDSILLGGSKGKYSRSNSRRSSSNSSQESYQQSLFKSSYYTLPSYPPQEISLQSPSNPQLEGYPQGSLLELPQIKNKNCSFNVNSKDIRLKKKKENSMTMEYRQNLNKSSGQRKDFPVLQIV